MKTIKAICTAAILALALTVPAYAGDISTPGVVCTAGEIGCPGAAVAGEAQTPGITSTVAGEISTPGLLDILLTVLTLI